jgi:hypothetical protein
MRPGRGACGVGLHGDIGGEVSGEIGGARARGVGPSHAMGVEVLVEGHHGAYGLRSGAISGECGEILRCAEVPWVGSEVFGGSDGGVAHARVQDRDQAAQGAGGHADAGPGHGVLPALPAGGLGRFGGPAKVEGAGGVGAMELEGVEEASDLGRVDVGVLLAEEKPPGV